MNSRWFGMNPPFFGGQEGVLSRQEDEKLIKNDILQLLFTVPGERVMRPFYGTILRSSVFELNDDQTLDAVKQSIATAIETEEPRVNLTVLELTRVPDANRLNIYISVVLKNDPRRVINIERLIDLTLLQ